MPPLPDGAYHPDSLLDAVETHLADGLRRDAALSDRMEATARVLLAVGPQEGVRMRDLAERVARDPSTVTRFVLRATREGLVEQRKGTDDRRERLLHLTAAGRAAREDLLRRRHARTAGISRGVQARTGLGPDEVEWFLRALHAALVEPTTPTSGS
jgi:DNA-binding MarR family transcriptional regulator